VDVFDPLDSRMDIAVLRADCLGVSLADAVSRSASISAI
jgi:hypothetical protein